MYKIELIKYEGVCIDVPHELYIQNSDIVVLEKLAEFENIKDAQCYILAIESLYYRENNYTKCIPIYKDFNTFEIEKYVHISVIMRDECGLILSCICSRPEYTPVKSVEDLLMPLRKYRNLKIFIINSVKDSFELCINAMYNKLTNSRRWLLEKKVSWYNYDDINNILRFSVNDEIDLNL